jgi:CDP-6-deoxy-D-xylo-4-hexulose-3-dehydrase
MLGLREIRGVGEVVLSPLGWVSDVASVLHAGLTPRFVDIDPVTLGVATDEVVAALNPDTRAILVTHILGLNAFTPELIACAVEANVPLIEDVCESHGATYQDRRLGSIGFASNFSFYYAHHLTTIEGGAVCTNDPRFGDVVRMLRSHGLVRESRDAALRERYAASFPDLNSEFIFAYPARNNRPTELSGLLGLSQLPRLNDNVVRRKANFARFMAQLDGDLFRNWYDTSDSSNYAFILVLREPDNELRNRVESVLMANGIEFRRGLSGGGNQLRQPYVRRLFPELRPEAFPQVEHVHHFGWYVGNHPGIEAKDIDRLCELINGA